MTALAQTERMDVSAKNLLQITASARTKLAELLPKPETRHLPFACLFGGGCGGMAYGMTYADQTTDYDHVIETPELKVVVDAVALNFLHGAEIDFTADSLNPSFVFRNATRPPKWVAADAAAAVVAAGAAVAKPRVLLVAPRDSYRTAPYIAAARKQGVDLLIASEGKHTLSGLDLPGVQVNLHDTPASLKAILTAVQEQPFVGVIGTDDASTELAVQAGMRLQLPHIHSFRCVSRAARTWRASSGARRRASTPPLEDRPDNTARTQLTHVIYPCVVKPVALSASRGVIRADDRLQLEQAIGALSACSPMFQNVKNARRC